MFIEIIPLGTKEKITINSDFIKLFTNKSAQSVDDDMPITIVYTKIALKNGEVYDCEECYSYLNTKLNV